MPIRPLHALSSLAAALLLTACASPYGGHWHWHQHTAAEAAGMPCGGPALGGAHDHGGMHRGGMGMGGYDGGMHRGGMGRGGGHDHGGPGMMGGRGHDHDHGPGDGPGGYGPGPGGMPRGGPGMMGQQERGGMNRMCEMHREMTAGKSPAEQQAAIEAHIRNMHGSVTAEMVEQHRKMMDSRCPPVAAAPASAPAAR